MAIERFRYHAEAFALRASLELPRDDRAPDQAFRKLPPEGGLDHESVPAYNFLDIASFSSATTVVSGSQSTTDRTFDSLATVTIEGFNVLGVVTADKIVSRITSIHPADGSQPTILPLGSHFENLRIGGRPVTVDLATDTFSRLGTRDQVRDAYRKNEEGFREEFNSLAMLGKQAGILESLRSYFPFSGRESSDAIPEQDGKISCSLVRKISGLGRKVTELMDEVSEPDFGVVSLGHTIYIRGFGVVRLAEFEIEEKLRRLTMISIDLGSTPKGKVSGGHVEGNGSGW